MESDLRTNDNLENGNHFLTLLKSETARLNALVVSAERDLESDDTVPEEVRGKLRVAVGKAKMLLKKKFVQFKDLCLKNLGIESDVRYPVTSEDLAGYWDTIVIQILQVYKIFEEVDNLKKNNWEDAEIYTAVLVSSTTENESLAFPRPLKEVAGDDESHIANHFLRILGEPTIKSIHQNRERKLGAKLNVDKAIVSEAV